MSSFAIPKGGLFDFVPSPQPRKAKSVSNRRAAARKAQQEAVKRARTPNANAISPKPNPLKPVGGAGILGIAALGVILWSAWEGLFSKSTARSALDEIDPALLYPPSPEVIGETLLPSRTKQGYGDIPGIIYEIYWEWDNDVEREEEPHHVQRIWFQVNSYYRSPIHITAVTYYGAYETYIGFPEVKGIGRGGRWRLSGTAYSQSGELIEYSEQAPGQGGIFTTARGKFLNMRPQGGQPSPPIVEVNQTTATAIPVIPIDNEFFQRDSYIAYERLSKGRYKPRPAPRLPNPPKPEQILDPDPVTADGRIAQPTATPVENPIQATNQENELDPQSTTPTDIDKAPIQQKDPIQEVTKEKIKEPTKTVEWRSTGTGSSEVKVTVETTADGTKTETIETSTGQVVSIKRTRPTNLRTSDISARGTPIANNDTARLNNLIGGQGQDLLLDDPVIGTPDTSGIGIKTIPEPEAFKQTPTPDPDDLGNDDLAKIAALIAATSLTADGVKTSVEDAVCDSLDSGCMKSKLKDPLDGRLDGLNAVLQGADLSLLTTINNKLGDAIPDGIGGYLKKAWEGAQIDKIINLATLVTSTHNAAMLSRNLGETIGEVASQALNLLGIQHQGQPIDVNQIVGNTIQGIIEALVPENIRTSSSETWLRLSRIHSAAVAMSSAIYQTKNALLEVNEITADWVARIGNTHQEQGIVEEDSYPWMQENNNFTDPYTGYLGKLNNIEEVVQQASSFVNSAVELQDSVEQLATSNEELTTALNEFNANKAEEETTKDTESESPDIANTDLIKDEGETTSS